MEKRRLAESRTRRLQAPKAHLPSREAWERQGSPPPPTSFDEVLVGPTDCRSTRHPRQSRQANRWRRWGEKPLSFATIRPSPTSPPPGEGPPDPSGLDSQARINGETSPGYSHDRGSGASDLGEAHPRTGVGSTLRTPQLRIPPRTLLSRCHRSDLRGDPPQAEIRLGCGHCEMLRSHQP